MGVCNLCVCVMGVCSLCVCDGCMQFVCVLCAVCVMGVCSLCVCVCDILSQWVPVTTEWLVPRLRIEEWPPTRRVVANKLNKQSLTTDEGWSSRLGVGEVLTTLPC